MEPNVHQPSKQFPYFCYKQAYKTFIGIGPYFGCTIRQLENS